MIVRLRAAGLSFSNAFVLALTKLNVAIIIKLLLK